MQIKIYAKLQKVEWIEELSGVKFEIIFNSQFKVTICQNCC